MAPVRIHAGDVVHYWDHLVMMLRDGSTGAETAFLSLYAITYSKTLGPGHVALLEVPGAVDGPLAALISDGADLGHRQRERLRALGTGRAALDTEPVVGSFERHPFDDSGFGFTIRWAGRTVVARWDEASAPMWVDGSAGGFSPLEDIWAIFTDAARPSLLLDGVRVPGEPYDDPGWVDRLPGGLGSAHAAFAEVRVEPG